MMMSFKFQSMIITNNKMDKINQKMTKVENKIKENSKN